jgi:hypothetical protein
VSGVAVALAFCWLGMVLAISFLEAPLKFRAPGLTLPVGLGIGRIVFRALNAVEAVFAAVLLVAMATGAVPVPAAVALGAAVVALAAQLSLVRPRLSRRTAAVLAGAHDLPRSRAHHAYIALEGAKVLALLAGGVLLLAS